MHHRRTIRAAIVGLIVIIVSIASADAVTPRTESQTVMERTVAPTQIMPKNAITDNAAEQPAKKASTLFPVRKAHDGVLTNIFSGHSWYTPPPAQPFREAPVFVATAPSAPPLPFEYIGRYEQENVATLFFLVKDDRVYDVKLGDIIEDTYSVDKISNGQLMFTYLPLNSSQGLRLGDQK